MTPIRYVEREMIVRPAGSGLLEHYGEAAIGMVVKADGVSPIWAMHQWLGLPNPARPGTELRIGVFGGDVNIDLPRLRIVKLDAQSLGAIAAGDQRSGVRAGPRTIAGRTTAAPTDASPAFGGFGTT